MRKEIEVKAKIENFDEVLRKLGDLGCKISEPKIQDDAIFVNFEDSFVDFKPGANFLRIRKSKGKVLFTIKQSQTSELDCIEYETEVSDADEMQKALMLMGYHEIVKVHKSRRKTNYGEYEICLDEVRNLGTFIEVEKIAEDGDGEKIQKELFDFLMTLGVRGEDRVLRGYDTLLYLKTQK